MPSMHSFFLAMTGAVGAALLSACATGGLGSSPGNASGSGVGAGSRALPGDAAAGARMLCGDQPVLVAYGDDGARVTVNERTIAMTPVRAASGARFAVPKNPATTWWSRGDRALLMLDGERLPECAPLAASVPLRARGNEPFWHLDIDSSAVVMTAPDPQPSAAFDAPQTERTANGTRYRAATGAGRAVTVLLEERTCSDSMSGMPYPLSATVTLDGQVLRGCAGDPAWLLTGGMWLVEDIAARGIVDRSHITLDFRPDGTLGGSTGCNRYRARWSLSGEGLRVDVGATTRRGCPPALLNQERKFLEMLGRARRFRLDATGLLTVEAGQGSALSARLAHE